jgi:hypothetical protein
MATAKAKKAPREDGDGIDFEFSDGNLLECLVSKIPQTVRDHLVLHGLSQKVGDAYAGMYTVEECIEAATAMYERLVKGEWTAARQAGEGKGVSQLLEAVMQVTGKPKEVVQAMLDSKTDEEKKGIRNNVKVAAAILQIQAAKAAAKAAKAAEAAGADDSSFSM